MTLLLLCFLYYWRQLGTIVWLFIAKPGAVRGNAEVPTLSGLQHSNCIIAPLKAMHRPRWQVILASFVPLRCGSSSMQLYLSQIAVLVSKLVQIF